MAVVIQNSKQSKIYYGADVSGKVFKEMSDKIYARYLSTQQYKAVVNRDTVQYHYYGMKNELNSIFNQLNLPFVDSAVGGYWRAMQMKANAAIFNIPESTNTAILVIPSVVGMGLKDAVYLMENKGLKVMASGRGRVFSQSLLAGSTFIKGQTVTLFLN